MIKVLFSVFNKFVPERIKLPLVRLYKRMPFAMPQIIISPTLACNYKCSYCQYVKYWNEKSVAQTIKASEWESLLSKMPRSIVTVSGGEPTSYPGLETFLRAVAKKHVLSQVVSNISGNLNALINVKDLGFRIMTSFHKEMTDLESFSKNIGILKKEGFNIVVNFVATEENIKEYHYYKNYFENELKVSFKFAAEDDVVWPDKKIDSTIKIHGINYISDRKKFDNKSSKSCLGGSKFFVIMPNANVYRCYNGFWCNVTSEYRCLANEADLDRFCLGNLKDANFRIDSKRFICHSPCRSICDIELADVKIK